MTRLFNCLLFFTLFISSLSAQIAKRNLILGGTSNLQFNTTKFNFGGSSTAEEVSETDFTFFLGPSVQYFISDQLAVGGSLIYGSTVDMIGSFGLTADGRFYLSNSPSNGWFLTGQLGLLTGDGVEQFFGNAGIGYDAFITPNIAWESTITAGFLSDDEVIGNTSQFLLGTGLKFFFDRFPEKLPEFRNDIIQKGNVFRGISSGNISISRRNNATVSLINLQPTFGRFITDEFLLGANINLINISSGGFNSFSVGLTPFLRYYLNPEGKKIAPFGEVGGGINFSIISGDFVAGQNQTDTNPVFFGNIGFDYFIRPTVAFEAKFGYRFERLTDTFVRSQTGLTVGFQFFLDRN
ncbi:MAG: hypothetical protein AAGJ18_05770 [Bacteroidota bacterium]